MSEKEIEEYKERISKECLKTILDNHQHWLNKDCVGWENMRAKLSDANLSRANLSGAKNVPYIPMVCPE